jgi:trehalose-phosphatase
VNVPVHLFRVWEKVAPSLARPGQVALFTDFDGTLAPICSHPSDARLLAGTQPLLAACVKRLAVTGVVSGRRLLDVRRRVGVSGAWYAGVHGYALVSPRNRSFLLLSRVERERIARVARRLSRSLSGLKGIRVEYKEAAVAVHYRGASIASQRKAGRLVRSLSAESPDLQLMSGRKVWEFLPAGTVDKASAIRFILGRKRSRPTLVFLGDDVTDEAVFQQMGGIMVLVGKRRHTAARYWLRSPGEVRQFLQRCLRLWK